MPSRPRLRKILGTGVGRLTGSYLATLANTPCAGEVEESIMSNTTSARTTVALILTAGAALALASSCTQPSQRPYERKLASTGEPALHAVHDQRLRELMAGLNDMALDRMPQELEPGTADEATRRDIARIAESLAETSLQIPGVLEQVRMGDEDRRVFEALAVALSDESTELAKLARRNDVPGMRTTWDAMFSTCNACHKSFRILPVVGR